MCSTILVVDDSVHVHKQIEVFLKTAGYSKLLFAESAQEAFKHLNVESSGKEQSKVDLILMDINMPGISGVEACRQIKAIEHLRDIPIVMVTAEDTDAGLQLAFEAGAVDYIKKPVSEVELVVRVGSVLKLKHEMDERISREKELLNITSLLEESNQKLQQVNVILNRLSRIDGLTGIANRRHFDDLFCQEWKHAGRLSKPISLILVDIDFFKNFNDTYGHQLGDECLKQVAGALSMALKRPCDVIARYGGEEFVAFLPETDEKGAIMVAETMQVNMANVNIPHRNSPVSDKVTVSIGVSTDVPATNLLPGTLIADADKALYQAKQEGRNRIKITNR
ncbi:MAG: diguanylate cyclase [Planctomycetota bacterium]